MFINDSQNIIWPFWVSNFDKTRFQFIFYRYLGHYNVYMIDDYEDTCFAILALLTAIMSKKSLVEINRY